MEDRKDGESGPVPIGAHVVGFLFSQMVGDPATRGPELWRPVVGFEEADLPESVRLRLTGERTAAVLECGHRIVLASDEAEAAERGHGPETMRCAECEMERFRDRNA